jgi:hypothetical protein
MSHAPPRFGDAELSVLDYLSRRMSPWSGSTDFPEGAPASPHLVARRYGGNYRAPVLDYARFSIETWCVDRFKGQAALQEAIGHLLVAGHNDTIPRTAPGGTRLPRITKCFVESGPQFFPDGVSDCPRWISTVAVYLRSLDG